MCIFNVPSGCSRRLARGALTPTPSAFQAAALDPCLSAPLGWPIGPDLLSVSYLKADFYYERTSRRVPACGSRDGNGAVSDTVSALIERPSRLHE